MSPRLVLPARMAPACRADGVHWHRLIDYAATVDLERPTLSQYAIEHEWIRATGHLGSSDPKRPHAHRWTAGELRRALSSAMAGRELEFAVATLDGLWQTGPSVADRPSAVTDWIDNEDSVARTLHPELRPSRLRDS